MNFVGVGSEGKKRERPLSVFHCSEEFSSAFKVTYPFSKMKSRN